MFGWIGKADDFLYLLSSASEPRPGLGNLAATDKGRANFTCHSLRDCAALRTWKFLGSPIGTELHLNHLV